MSFVLGKTSRKNLEGVHPALVQVVERAIQITPVDFGVHEGLRTAARQKEYLRRGVTTVSFSKHQVQKDGFGHAVDLVPYVDGQLRWEWPLIYPIAQAMRDAALELGVRLRWGGSWEELTHSNKPPELMVEDYVVRRMRAGQRAFNDGPHYELLPLWD